MKKILALIFCLSLISQVFSQVKIKKVKNVISKNEYEVYHIAKEKNGNEYKNGSYSHYKGKKEIKKGEYVKNEKHGKWVTLTPDGDHEEYFINGHLDSIYGYQYRQLVSIKYDESGNESLKILHYSYFNNYFITLNENETSFLRIGNKERDTLISGMLKNDKMEGIWTFKSSNGVIGFHHYQDGKRVGKQESFYANGQPYAEYYCNQEGKHNGAFFVKFKNGDTAYYANYSNDKLNGNVICKRPDNSVFYTAFYENNRLINYREFNEDGTVNTASFIENGIGTLFTYSSNDGDLKITSIGNLKNGVYDGLVQNFISSYKIDTSYYVDGFLQRNNKNELKDRQIVMIPRNVFIPNATQPAQMGESEEDLIRFIARNTSYPVIAIEKNISGQILLIFKVNSLGYIYDIEFVSKKLGFGLEEEATRVLKRTSGYWFPAYEFGLVQIMQFRLPYRFQLN